MFNLRELLPYHPHGARNAVGEAAEVAVATARRFGEIQCKSIVIHSKSLLDCLSCLILRSLLLVVLQGGKIACDNILKKDQTT